MTQDVDSRSGTNPKDPIKRKPAPGWILPGLVFYGAVAASAWGWRAGFYEEPLFFTSKEASSRGVAWASDLGLGIATGMALLGLSAMATAWTGWGERLADRMAEVLAGMPWSHALTLALISGFGEELFFRGALQPRVGWLAASVLFGLLHVGPSRDFLPWTAFAMVAGAVFGGLFLTTGNLVAPIVAHTVVNGVNLPVLARRGRDLRVFAAAARRPVEVRAEDGPPEREGGNP